MGPCSVCIPGMIAEVKKKALLLQSKNAVDEHYTSTGNLDFLFLLSLRICGGTSLG